MTKSKRQLRAEAVERLRKLNCMDVDCYQLLEATVDDAGEKVGYRVEIRKLIDLLTDNEPTNGDDDGIPLVKDEIPLDAAESHGDAQRSVLSADADKDKGEDAKTAQDTREKLEDDIQSDIAALSEYGKLMLDWDVVMGWLDRQAAITEREIIERNSQNWHDWCDELGIPCIKDKAGEQFKAMQAEIAELQADNDYLRDINEKLGREVREWKGEARNQRNNFEQATGARKHWQRKYENPKATSCSAEVPSDESELARELGKALAERDMYRDKLGRAIDAAHSIEKLVDA